MENENKRKCGWESCSGFLRAVETQNHDNPNFAEYRTCKKCGYQWAKQYYGMCEIVGAKAPAF